MKVLMLAPPGGGKGTQGSRLAKELGVEHISSGDVLRAEIEGNTSLGRDVKTYIDSGRLAPDELVSKAVLGRLGRRDGYVLDGYPRTLRQADGLDFDAVVYLHVPDSVVERRLLARGRSDDTPGVIAERLRQYQDDTQPLIEHYRDVLVEVDGDRPEDEIAADLKRRLG